MPKIIIKELDKTTAGVGQYTNFSVVVPGLVASGKSDEGVFDENGIFETNSQSDFVKKVGKVAASEMVITRAEKPVLLSWEKYRADSGSDDGVALPEQVTETEFGLAFADTGVVLCKATPRSPAGTDFGQYFDEKYTYELVKDSASYARDAYYAILDKNHIGVDEEVGNHYGNQIAYELLGMGYTVLYKKFTDKDSLGDPTFWEPLKDKAAYDFRYVINGLIEGNDAANKAIVDLATYINNSESDDNGRGDCTALIDIKSEAYSGKTTADAIKGIKEALSSIESSKYGAIFAPYVEYNMAKDSVYQNTRFPAAFHYLACAAKAAETYNEWYAIAGYTRGASKYSISKTGVKLGDSAVNIFEPRYVKGGIDKAVNLIVKVKDNYYLWGNRTAEKLDKDGDLRASHFLNIRQLCTTIKKQTYVACRRFTFDSNSDTLWINFCNAIRPTLEKMKADQGIRDYKFIKVKTKQKAVLKAKIRIVPIEAVEDFDISLYLEDSLGVVTTEVEEE